MFVEPRSVVKPKFNCLHNHNGLQHKAACLPSQFATVCVALNKEEKMKKTLLALAITGLICSTTGCASGPLNQWFRGAPCNTCNPPIGASGNLNLAPPCDSGCGSSRNGFFGGFFDWLRPQSTQAPASLPGGVFPGDPGVQYYGDPGIPALEINPGTIGPLGSVGSCLLYTSPSPRDATLSRMPSSA